MTLFVKEPQILQLKDINRQFTTLTELFLTYRLNSQSVLLEYPCEQKNQ